MSLLAATLVVTPVEATIPFDSKTRFDTPTGSIRFLDGGSYEVAELENGFWHFQGLLSDNANDNASQNEIIKESPFVEDSDSWALSLNYGNLSVSTTNSNIVIENYDLITTMLSHGWLNYTVIGQGTQTLSFYYNDTIFPIKWTVQIDNENRPENDGWSVTEDGTVTIKGAKSNVAIRYEEVQPPHQEPPLAWTFREYLIFSVTTGSAIAVAFVLTALYFSGRKKKSKLTEKA